MAYININSTSGQISSGAVTNSWVNLTGNSPKIKGMALDILNSGMNINIQVYDSSSANPMPQSGPNPSNSNEYLINIPAEAFDGDYYYDKNNNINPISLERILSHELSHGVDLVNGVDQEEPGMTPTEIQEAIDRAEARANIRANDVMTPLGEAEAYSGRWSTQHREA